MSVEVFSNIIRDHVAKSRSANKHPAKLIVLSSLLKELFNVDLEELIPGIETKLGSKLLGLRGSADLVFSNVVFEIKVDLKAEIADAERKLLKYFQVLHEREPERKHVGIATDVIDFVAYLPVIKNEKVVGLNKIGSINIAEAPPFESILWLDSFIFSKHKIRPSAVDLRWRFGPESPTYSVAIDELTALWDEVKDEKDIALKLDLWAKNMEIVYGGKPEVSAFIEHTYLVTLVKLIVYLRLSGDSVISKDKLVRALTGEYFSAYGITNLIEEDFFAWILHPKIKDKALSLINDVAKELLRYDLSQIDEDFFKEIYQEIVKRSERHRIGEYYTPEWLAELILKESLELWNNVHKGTPRILDPACGSGTFLCNAIHIIRERLLGEGKSPREILDFILDSVVGVDINPLAVVIARANYVLALGDLLQLGKRIIVPIYVADSVRIPSVTKTLTERGGISVYEFCVQATNDTGKTKTYAIQIPENIASQKTIFSQIIESYKVAVNAYRARKNKKEALEVFERSHRFKLSDDENQVLHSTLTNILSLMDIGLDAIWVFMLSNIYAPITLSQSKFDIVIGNPPWIAMRYIENPDYQDFLKQQVLYYGLLGKNQVHLFTQMESATLFYCRCSDLYLRDTGLISFIMPRSVLTGALHHINFKQLNKPSMKLLKILDLEDVAPLFNVPSCVLISLKGGKTTYPVLIRKFKGQLPEKNVKLNEAIKSLQVKDSQYEPPKISVAKSYYYNLFKAGAAIYPRQFYFIDFDVHPILGVDIEKPLVKTSEDIDEKEPWKGIRLSGNVESNFIYLTLLGGDIAPFTYIKMRPIVLPVEASPSGYKILDLATLRGRGFLLTARWFEDVQKLWEARRSKKAAKRFPRFIDAVNYQQLLRRQIPRKRYIVIYNSSGTNLVSCVIDTYQLPKLKIGKAELSPAGFIAEKTTFFYKTDDENEAHYLCAILNSNVINDLIKPLQPRGSFGERHIQRRPFMFPIPKFKEEDPKHIELARISKQCHEVLKFKQFTRKTTAGVRSETKEIVAKEIKRIDKLVSEILSLS
jgi:methylase of polypeptide subunit release factors